MRRIVILGKTGAGKSCVGNTIFGENLFNVCHGFSSNEGQCSAITQSLSGREITLIDTPGFFDTNTPEKKLKTEMLKCITECSPGPHAFLIVLKLERFTEQENEVINKITKYFSEEVFRFATIVFTHGDDLPEGQNIKDYLRPNKYLSKLVNKCGGRCLVIDNKYWNNCSNDTYRNNSYQVKEILKSVEDIVIANDGNCYTNKMLSTMREIIKRVAQLASKFLGKMAQFDKEIWQKAKKAVCDHFTKLKGIRADVLLKAFLGKESAATALALLMNSADIEAAAAGVVNDMTTGTAAGATSGEAVGITAGTAAGATSGPPAGPAGFTV